MDEGVASWSTRSNGAAESLSDERIGDPTVIPTPASTVATAGVVAITATTSTRSSIRRHSMAGPTNRGGRRFTGASGPGDGEESPGGTSTAVI